MLRIAVADDEPVIIKQMERILCKVCGNWELEIHVDLYQSGMEMLSGLSQTVYHLIFLDIEMEDCSGIEVSRFLRDTQLNDSTQIVYVSGKNGYDRQLFEFRPFHFLAKPVSERMVSELIGKYIRVYGNKQDLFQYRQGHSVSYLQLDSILYFESIGRKVKIKTVAEEILYYGSIQQVLEQLQNKGFFSPHKSFVVNYRFVKTFRPIRLVLTNDEWIPISKSRRYSVSRMQLEMENGGYDGDI